MPRKPTISLSRKPFELDVKIWREASGVVKANIPWSVVQHSPTGYGVGYGGSGPADLALNILNAFVPPGKSLKGEDADVLPVSCFRGKASVFAWRHHQDFKRDFIAAMEEEGGVIRAEVIREWIRERRAIHEAGA